LFGAVADLRRTTTPEQLLHNLHTRGLDGVMEGGRKAVGRQIAGIHAGVEQSSNALEITRVRSRQQVPSQTIL
jgi:hypothetical protein